MERSLDDALSVEEMTSVLVERLDVRPGDIVLVVVPSDWDYAQLKSAAESFAWLNDEKGAIPFVVPDSLTFKVVRADA